MSLTHLTKSISFVANIVGLLTVGNFLLINSAQAFSVNFNNGSFEAPIAGSQNDWQTTGDVTSIGVIDGISPTNLSNQAIITNSFIQNNNPDPSINRNDDNGFKFNQSGTNPVDADTNSSPGDLQSHFGFKPDAFSIDRTGGLTGLGPRTSKEGSGIYQDFVATVDPGEDSVIVSFDWAYLTNEGSNSTFNEGSSSTFGEQDFAFWSLGQQDTSTNTFNTVFNGGDEIDVLKSSIGAIIFPNADNVFLAGFDYATNGRFEYTVDGLIPGTYTYRVGYGVIDVDGVDRSSALLIDDVTVVPFEFSPGFGLLLMAGVFGLNYLRRQQLSKS